MKVVNAVWEQRNIGVKTVEVVIEETDKKDVIQEVVHEQHANYIVVKVPAGRYEVNEMLMENDFVFVETICNLRNDLRRLTLDMINERMKNQMKCKIMTEKDLDILYKDFENGIFTTDRIAIDPHFSVKLANERYIGWIGDAICGGSQALNIYYKDQLAGFIVYKIDGDIANVLLGGMYSNYVTKGIGVAVYSKAYEYLKDQGVKRTFTAVSTNNNSSYRANMAIGYDVYEFEYVFVKHLK